MSEAPDVFPSEESTMKIISKSEIDVKHRDDGRTVNYYPPFNIPEGTKQIGFITCDTPKNCNEANHRHPVSHEIFYQITAGKFRVNGKIYELEAGDIVVMEPGDEHHQIADKDTKVLALRIPLSLDKELVEAEDKNN